MQIAAVGLDLAKNVFQVHGVNEHGTVVLRKQLRRDQVAAFFANLPPCLVGMEACSSPSLGAQAGTMGHTARLMAPQFVKPYGEQDLQQHRAKQLLGRNRGRAIASGARSRAGSRSRLRLAQLALAVPMQVPGHESPSRTSRPSTTRMSALPMPPGASASSMR